ncbi:MAG: sugar phosphate isomerase/epimerase family protein [Pseudomonadota bacterium]
MADLSNSKPVLGAAITLPDLEGIEGLAAFLRDRDRDVEIQDLSEPDAMAGGCSDFADAAARAFAGHAGRVGIHGPFCGIALDAQDTEIRGIAARRMVAAVEACIHLAPVPGAAHMVVHSPITTWDSFNSPNRPGARQLQIELVHDSLGPAVRLAEESGVTIVIENIEDRDTDAWVGLAASFDSPAVRLSLDTGHAHYAFGRTGGPPVDYFVKAAGDLLAHVHLQDADGYADRHWRIGEGNICWPSVFGAIGALSERPRLILEMDDARDIMPSAAWLEGQGLAE